MGATKTQLLPIAEVCPITLKARNETFNWDNTGLVSPLLADIVSTKGYEEHDWVSYCSKFVTSYHLDAYCSF